jgi:hypothetical protein
MEKLKLTDLSPLEKTVLDGAYKLARRGLPWVSQEDMFRETGIGIWRAFKVMDKLKEDGYLSRQGWNFSITAQGVNYVRTHHQYSLSPEEPAD